MLQEIPEMKMKKQLLYRILCTHLETNAAFELRLFNYIRDFKDGCVNNLSRGTIDEQVNYIIEHEPNINYYNEDKVGEIFGIADYEKQRLVLELIYYLVGERLLTTSSTVSLDQLGKWEDCGMQYGFFLSYILKKSDIKRLISEIPLQSDYILNNSRECSASREEFIRCCKFDLNPERSDDEIIDNINLYNDGAYVSLPLGIDMLENNVLKEGYYDLWLQIYKTLHYVPLQGCLIYKLHTIKDCIEVLNEEKKNNVEHRKVFAFLMRKRVFELLKQEPDLLKRNAGNEELDEDARKQASTFLKEWNQKKEEYIKSIITESWLNSFNADEMLEWLSTTHRQSLNMRGIYQIMNIEALNLIESVEFENRDYINIDLTNKDVNTLIYYIAHVKNLSNKKSCAYYVENLCNKIYTEKNLYVPWLMNEECIKEMRAVYACLNESECNGLELAKQHFNDKNEGYKSSIGESMRVHQGNKIWLSILMLRTESNESVDEFMECANYLLECAEKCDSMLSENYLMPFGIAESLVVQLINTAKDEFEKQLINRIYDIVFVVSILMINKGNLDEENKIELAKRIAKEWKTAKYMTTFTYNIEYCEQYMKDCGLINEQAK